MCNQHETGFTPGGTKEVHLEQVKTSAALGGCVDLQHSPHLGAAEKCRFLAPSPDLLGVGPSNLFWNHFQVILTQTQV